MASEEKFEIVERANVLDIEEANTNLKELVPLHEIKEWLEPTLYEADSGEYKRHLLSRAPHTCQWILDAAPYRRWIESSEHGALWIKAVPGTGKSVLAASLVNRFLEQNVPTVFFFFRQIVTSNHKPISLVKDWLAQLLPHSVSLQGRLSAYIWDNKKVEAIPLVALWSVLEQVIEDMPQIYMVADALDEMEQPNDSFLAQLVSLSRTRPSKVKLLLLSRPLPAIEKAIRSTNLLHYRLDASAMTGDVERFARYMLKPDEIPSLTDDIMEAIVTTILKRGQGLFLYAKLMTDEIVKTINVNSVDLSKLLPIIEKLPLSVEDMYARLLHEHANKLGLSMDVQISVLSWVTHAKRQLRLLELTRILHHGSDDTMSLQDRKALVRSACGPLLEVLEDETVQVIHHSFTEFLLDERRHSARGEAATFPVVSFASTHRELACRCLSFLTAEHIKDPKLFDRCQHRRLPSNRGRIQHDDSLVAYASEFWDEHVRASGASDSFLFSAIDAYFKVCADKDFQILHNEYESASYDPSCAECQKSDKKNAKTPLRNHSRDLRVHGLQFASILGLESYCKHLIAQEVDLNAVDVSLSTSLKYAARSGYDGTVKLLLENGADLKIADAEGLTACHEAAIANHYRVLRLLFRNGASPMDPKLNDGFREPPGFVGSKGKTPWILAASKGSVNAILEMIDLVDSHARETGLWYAAFHKQPSVVQAILSGSRTSANASLFGDSALYAAASNHDMKSVNTLLEYGASISSYSNGGAMHRVERGLLNLYKPENFTSVLHGWAAHKPNCCGILNEWQDPPHKEALGCLRSLLEAGADMNTVDQDGATPLVSLLRREHWNLHLDPKISANAAIMLLEAGADPTVADNDGNTVLHYAASQCQDGVFGKICTALVRSGAKPNLRNNLGDTPIILAALNENLFDFGSLIKHGADPRATDDNGKSLLHRYLEIPFRILCGPFPCTEKKVESLINIGVPLDRPDSNGNYLYHNMSENDLQPDILGLLLKAGMIIENRDVRGRDALLTLVERSRWNRLESLAVVRAHGAEINARDKCGKTALHLACRNGLVVLECLIGLGLDPVSATDFLGNGLAHELAGWIKEDATVHVDDETLWMEQLQIWGVNLNGQNKLNQTPLQIALTTYSDQPERDSRWIRKMNLINFLLEGSSDRDLAHVDIRGRTALMYACRGHGAYTSLLLEKGADPSLKDADLRTSLHHACIQKNANSLYLILQYIKGSHETLVEERDKHGKTAFFYAVQSGVAETVHLLLEFGANCTLRDAQGIHPLVACAGFSPQALPANSYHDRFSVTVPAQLDVAKGFSMEALAVALQIDFSSGPSYVTGDIVRVARLLLGQFDITNDLGTVRVALQKVQSSKQPRLLEELLEKERRLSKKHSISGQHPEHLIDETLLMMEHKNKLVQQRVESFVDDPISFINSRPRNDVEELLRDYRSVKFIVEHHPRALFHKVCESESALHYFARHGLVDSMRQLQTVPHMVRDAMQTEPDFDQPLLHVACDRQTYNMPMLQLLVAEMGVDANARDRYEKTALHIIVARGACWSAEGVKYLAQHGADVNANRAWQGTPILASRYYQVVVWRRACVLALLESGADPNMCPEGTRSCLSREVDDLELMKILLDHGADVNLASGHVLIAAVMAKRVEVVEFLLKAGVDPKSARALHGLHDYYSPEREHTDELLHRLRARSMNANHRMTNLLISHGAPYQELLFEFSGQREIELFLDHPNIDWSVRDEQGNTPIMMFGTVDEPAEDRLARFKRMLLKAPDVQAKNNAGENLLHRLVIVLDPQELGDYLCIEDVRNLLNQADHKGCKPIHLAQQHWRWESCKKLANYGADIFEADGNGDTILQFVVGAYMRVCDPPTQFARELLNLGADINFQNKQGNPPWFRFFGIDHWDRTLEQIDNLLDGLIRFGIDFKLRNNAGQNACHILAARPGKGDHSSADNIVAHLFRRLVDQGVDPLEEDNALNTSLDVASRNNHTCILKMFSRDV